MIRNDERTEMATMEISELTDRERLQRAFAALRKQGFKATMNAQGRYINWNGFGLTEWDYAQQGRWVMFPRRIDRGLWDMNFDGNELRQTGLSLYWGGTVEDGATIVATLRDYGFIVEWSGSRIDWATISPNAGGSKALNRAAIKISAVKS